MSDAMACTLVVESIMAQSTTVLADVAAIAEQAGIAYTTHVRWGIQPTQPHVLLRKKTAI
jgi:hypothetical protein